MTMVVVNPEGGYRYIEGVFQYSGGVAAEPGYRIERAQFRRPVPLQEGFKQIRRYLDAIGRSVDAFCSCELRSPRPFDEESFAVFNRQYVDPLENWGVFRNGKNPIARTNVCPAVGAPDVPSFYAFSYTVESNGQGDGGFIVAGSAEVPEGKGSYRDHTICLGDQSVEGLTEKAIWVCEEMERRMALLGFGWEEATDVGLYTVFDIHPFLEKVLVERIGGNKGLTWHYSRPPVDYLDYEMDTRSISRNIIL